MAESMESLLLDLQFEKAKSIALQVSHNEEKALRIKAEASLQELRRVHETLACDCEMSEEFIVNKVIAWLRQIYLLHSKSCPRGQQLTEQRFIITL